MLHLLPSWLRTKLPLSAADGRRDPLGPRGEQAAARYLRRQGYRVLGRNLRVPMGEADLLCEGPDKQTIVLVEVKARRAVAADPGARAMYAPPELSITIEKRRKLRAILRHLVRANGWSNRPARIDVVAIEWPEAGEPVVRHHEAAVR